MINKISSLKIPKYLLIIFFLIVAPVIWPESIPAWLLLKRGMNSYRDGYLEESVNQLRLALETHREYPEAHYWLAKVYEAQGSGVLALEHYRNAIRYARYLRNNEDEINILYDMADILIRIGDEYKEEALNILHGIIDIYNTDVAKSLEINYRYVNLVSEKGLDELVYLYRNELGFTFEARKKLAQFSWEDREYKSALLHSTLVVLSFFSQLAAEYREKYPEWRFDIDIVKDSQNPGKDVRFPGMTDGITDLVNMVYDSEPFLAKWLEDEAFWAYLYLLSISLYANGAEESARSVWLLISYKGNLAESGARRVESGQWGRLSYRQLEKPFISGYSISP